MEEEKKRLVFIDEIGEGGYGKVWAAKLYKDGEPPQMVAVKVPHKEKTLKIFGSIEYEFETLKAIEKHRHIIEYKEFGKDADL